MTRELALNNPCGIVHSKILWAGQAEDQPDPVFVKFISALYGLRAAARNYIEYGKLHGLTTVAQVITRASPPQANDTSAYIRAVCEECGVGPSAEIAPIMLPFMKAVIRQENGVQPFDDELIQQAILLAE